MIAKLTLLWLSKLVSGFVIRDFASKLFWDVLVCDASHVFVHSEKEAAA